VLMLSTLLIASPLPVEILLALGCTDDILIFISIPVYYSPV